MIPLLRKYRVITFTIARRMMVRMKVAEPLTRISSALKNLMPTECGFFQSTLYSFIVPTTSFFS